MDIDQPFYDNSTINDLVYNNNPKQNGYHHYQNGHNHMLMDIDIENTSHNHYHSNGVNGNCVNNNDNEFLIKIQHDYIPIEKITPDLIIKMNKQEKQIYIDKCRQLYTAMIE